MPRLILALTAAVTVGLPAARGQSSLPIAEEVDGKALRAHCRRLLQALETLQAPLPAELDQQLRAVLDDPALDADTVSVRIQNLLDSRCLVGVTINPESRVKAARGSLPAILFSEGPTLVLLKVHNEAGVTHPLVVTGPEVRSAETAGPDRWLEAAVAAAKPLGKNLSGEKVEYVLLRLTAQEKGKREATLRFDVGQGTQDLGFRAEVPILFTVR
jgi:hypothetical protein